MELTRRKTPDFFYYLSHHKSESASSSSSRAVSPHFSFTFSGVPGPTRVAVDFVEVFYGLLCELNITQCEPDPFEVIPTLEIGKFRTLPSIDLLLNIITAIC